jgi:hypothetical protein
VTEGAVGMTVIKKTAFSIIERFPDRKQTIARLFRQNESFQNLCEDYRLCTEALQHWRQSTDTDGPVRSQEYEALLRELEDEIVQSLNESTACGESI